MKITIAIAFTMAFCMGSVHAQGTFQNLDFASASIPAGTQSGSFVPISAAIPGWTGYFGTAQQTSVFYDDASTGAVEISIQSGNQETIPGSAYMLILQSGLGNNNVGTPAALAQMGFIPGGTQSILFTSAGRDGVDWSVTIAGQNIPVVAQSQLGNYSVYAGDISAFAGQTDELRFTANAGPDYLGAMDLDNIMFSDNPVPEPSTLALGILVIFSFAFCHRRKIL